MLCLLVLSAPSAPRINKECKKQECERYARSWTCSIIISWEPPEQINAKEIRQYFVRYSSNEMVQKIYASNVTEAEIDNLGK